MIQNCSEKYIAALFPSEIWIIFLHPIPLSLDEYVKTINDITPHYWILKVEWDTTNNGISLWRRGRIMKRRGCGMEEDNEEENGWNSLIDYRLGEID